MTKITVTGVQPHRNRNYYQFNNAHDCKNTTDKTALYITFDLFQLYVSLEAALVDYFPGDFPMHQFGWLIEDILLVLDGSIHDGF